MSIKDFSEKIKDLAHFRGLSMFPLSEDLFLGLIIALVAIGAFGLGRISKIEGSKTPIRIENEPAPDSIHPVKQNIIPGGQSASVTGTRQPSDALVASKSGTKYYYSWCSGVQKIAAANRIYFATKSEAEARGYTPSSTCKGL